MKWTKVASLPTKVSQAVQRTSKNPTDQSKYDSRHSEHMLPTSYSQAVWTDAGNRCRALITPPAVLAKLIANGVLRTPGDVGASRRPQRFHRHDGAPSLRFRTASMPPRPLH